MDLHTRKHLRRVQRKIWKDPARRQAQSDRVKAMWLRRKGLKLNGITPIEDFKVTICKYCKRPF